MEKLADPAHYSVDPDNAWHRIKAPSRKPDVLGRLKALAAWREREARTKNLPRGRIVKDETLADLAAHPPKQQDGLGGVRGQLGRASCRERVCQYGEIPVVAVS